MSSCLSMPGYMNGSFRKVAGKGDLTLADWYIYTPLCIRFVSLFIYHNEEDEDDEDNLLKN